MTEVAIKLMDKQDLNYNQINKYNNTAFSFVCRNNLEKIAIKLLEKPDLNYNQIVNKNNTAFIWVDSFRSNPKGLL